MGKIHRVLLAAAYTVAGDKHLPPSLSDLVHSAQDDGAGDWALTDLIRPGGFQEYYHQRIEVSQH